jgi:SH3 domain-containing protein
MGSMLSRFVFALAALALPVLCAAGEAGHATRDLDVLAEPRLDAKVIWKLPKDAALELLQRQNAWAEISSGGQRGWVLFFSLGIGQAPKQNVGKELGGIVGLATNQNRGQVTATIGVRGITEEQLKGAKFNEQELRKLESLAVPPAAANSYASQAGLKSREVRYLPAPASESASNDAKRAD